MVAPELAGRRTGRTLDMVGIAALAFLGRLLPVLRGGGLLGRDTYDPFVYYSAAVSLATGHLPYQDFLFLHPPGILLVLLPAAGLGAVAGDAVGMAAARVAFMMMGAASALLIYRILIRYGRAAAVTGACLYAVWFPAFYSERDVRLEGLAGLLVLLGLLVVERMDGARRPVGSALAAGTLFGAAATVKIWGVLPVVVLAGWLWWRYGRRHAAAAALGAVAAASQVLLPFAVTASQFVSLVVLEQFGRPRREDPLDWRLLDILGLGPLPGRPLVALLCAVVLAAAALLLASRLPTGRLHALLVVGGVGVLLAAPRWYPHYAAFVAGPLCLVFGRAVGVILARVGRAGFRRAVLAALALGLGAAQVLLLTQEVGVRFPGRELADVLAGRPGCVTTDRPAALVLSNTLRRNLDHGCPIVVDPLGYKFVLQRTEATPEANARRFNQVLTDYLGTGSTAVVVTTRMRKLDPDSRRRIESWPVVAQLEPRVRDRNLVRQPDPGTAVVDWDPVLGPRGRGVRQ